jgi:hypothetical protein
MALNNQIYGLALNTLFEQNGIRGQSHYTTKLARFVLGKKIWLKCKILCCFFLG